MAKSTIISCYNDGKLSNVSNLVPVGFGWINDLISLKKAKNLIVLLHGGCLKYGLRNSVYNKQFGNKNPYKKLLTTWMKLDNISIKICELCLAQNGYTVNDVISGIESVPFSIQYLIEQQQEGSIVIYDAPLQPI